jgi:ubiquitin-conjugating enzyme E2 R
VGDNLFTWHVYIEGPAGTPYARGVFKLLMTFPDTYPMAPPTLTFLSKFWHPNVYPDGRVCLSILHAPGHDPMSGELPEERWLPTQTVSTVVLSLISMLGEPNFSSPANVDASVQWRKDAAAYKAKVAATIEAAKRDVPPHITIPHPDTDPVERKRAVEKLKLMQQLDNGMLDDVDDFANYDEDDFDAADFDEDGDDDGDDNVDNTVDDEMS